MYMDILKDVLAWLSSHDTALFLFLNSMHNDFSDSLMWLVSDRLVWLPLYLLLACLVMRRGGLRCGMLCLVFIAVAVCLADQACSSLIRPLVGRLRPSNADNPISVYVHTVNGYAGGRYGFPSCHAANTAALAFFLSSFFRRRRALVSLSLWSLLVSYSRIYLGVHYPGDILAGMLIGCSCAAVSASMFRHVERWTCRYGGYMRCWWLFACHYMLGNGKRSRLR